MMEQHMMEQHMMELHIKLVKHIENIKLVMQ